MRGWKDLFGNEVDGMGKRFGRDIGPAFPSSDAQFHFLGMSIRDYFAGQAINALVRKGNAYDTIGPDAYRIADSVLAAREERAPPPEVEPAKLTGET